ncbi:MAG: peptide deformylase [Acidobacteriota bacterium]
MIRTVLKYGAPELEIESSPVSLFDGEIETLAQDMLETMYGAPGIGLAAPQLGLNICLIVVDITGGEEQGHQYVLVNPEITEREGSQDGEEGCLSIPGFTAVVERPSWVAVSALNLDGTPREMEAEGLLARVLCHEVDHLNGILYLDHLSVLKRDLIKRKIRRLVRAGEW